MLWEEDKWADSDNKIQERSDLLEAVLPFLFCQWEYLYTNLQRKPDYFLPKVIIYDTQMPYFIHIGSPVFRESWFFLLLAQDSGFEVGVGW